MKRSSDILYGIHPVREALRAGRRQLRTLYLGERYGDRRLAPLKALAAAHGIPVKTVPAADLRKLAGTDMHQGACLEAGALPLMEITALISRIDKEDKAPFLLLLDCVVDPNNLGALVRTALCAGVDGVVIPRDRSAAPTPAADRASAGAMEHIRLTRVTNMVTTIQQLKTRGLWVVGADRHASQTLFATDLTGPLGLVIGGEEKGLRPLVKKTCDQLTAIPQSGAVDSLNASAAGAVLMYEALRQRSRKERSTQ